MSICDEIRNEKSARKIKKIIESHPDFENWEGDGKHVKARFTRNRKIPVTNHPDRDIPIGTRKNIIAALKAFGLCSLLLIGLAAISLMFGG
jgi:predicted RNA binding protein YcfA (HicA-like mRNA interferase family)